MVHGQTANLLHLSLPDVVGLLEIYHRLAIGGVFHNDLQVSNCIRDSSGKFHIVDFGIASTDPGPDGLAQHMCQMASLLLQSILCPAGERSSAFSAWKLTKPAIRTRYVEHMIFGVVRWLRSNFVAHDDAPLLVSVNVREVAVVGWRLRRFFGGLNSGFVISPTPPAAPRRIPAKKVRDFSRKVFEISENNCVNKMLF
jgi:serine/threonine protein kinase